VLGPTLGGGTGRGSWASTRRALGSVLGTSWQLASTLGGCWGDAGNTARASTGAGARTSTGHTRTGARQTWDRLGRAGVALRPALEKLGTSLGDALSTRLGDSLGPSLTHWVHHWEMHSGHRWDWHWARRW
jgi:hypothetical protein